MVDPVVTSQLETQLVAEAGLGDVRIHLQNSVVSSLGSGAAAGSATGLATAPHRPPPPPVPAITRHRELYLRAHELVNNAATTAATQVATDLVAAGVDPILQTSVSDFQTAIAAEVQKVMTMSPADLAAAPNPDPNMRAVVGTMNATLAQNRAATVGGLGPARPLRTLPTSIKGSWVQTPQQPFAPTSLRRCSGSSTTNSTTSGSPTTLRQRPTSVERVAEFA